MHINDTMDIDESDDFNQQAGTTKRDFFDLIEIEASGLIAELKANSSVTTSTVITVAQSCDTIVELIVEYAKACFSDFLRKKTLETDTTELFDEIDSAAKPFKNFKSDYQQKKFFSNQPGFVKPVELVLGSDYEIRQCKNGIPVQKLLHRTWQYIPIAFTIQSVLSDSKIFKKIKETQQRTDGIIEEFYDGAVCKNHPLFSATDKLSLKLELYYDDMETTNPIGSKPVIHKIGIFYFLIKNLPSLFNSTNSNIHLLGLAYTGDLKQFGYHRVLEKIAEDVKILEIDGVEITVNGGNEKIYASIGAVNGDNLGRHTIFGLFESFNAKRFCETCMASREEIQVKFLESDFELRKKDEYEKQLKEIKENPRLASEYGIKTGCALHETYWHLTSNRIGDLMHDFMEGVGPFEIKLILSHLVNKEKRLTLKFLNKRITSFPYGFMDKKSRPSEINNLDCSMDHSLKQKAFQFWTLFRLLPLIIGDQIPPENAYWEFYLELREIADLLCAQKWTVGMACYFEQLYAHHLSNFKMLFPDANLIPKHHFLIHYPTFAMHTGPPYKTMVAAQELKGNFFKRSAHVVCCFTNIPFTLAWKHQFHAHLCNQSGKRFCDNIEVITAVSSSKENVPCAEGVKKIFDDNDEIQLITKLKIGGREYREGQVLVLRKDDENQCIFGKVFCFISKNSSMESLHVIVKNYETVTFETHFWSYLVRDGSNYELLPFSSLIDNHPLDAYSGNVISDFFIPLRYCVF